MTLTGFVFDSSGNPVSGATVQGYVSADNATTTAEASTTTNSNGKWSISTSTAARIPMDVKITFGDSVRWLKAGDSINVSKLTLTDTLTVGEDDLGFDVIFYGATASANMTWDASEDDLILSGAARIVVPEGQLVLGSAAVSSTAAELNILDGVTATASELNLLDGDTSVGGSITIADTDGFVVNDGGTMKTIPASDISTYVAASVGDITAVSLTGDSGGALSVASGTAGFTLTGGTGIDTSGSGTTITFSLDLNELTAAAVNVANDSIVLIDADDSNASKKESVADFVSGIASTGLTASSGTLSVNASQAITALTGGDLTIYEDANNADVSFKMGTSATESLTIQVLNGGSNKTAEEIHFSTATASGTANHGKMVFDIDGTDQMEINDSGVSITGDLTISGDDLFMNTNTAGHILVGDDTNYNPVAVSGDVTLASNGAVTIANDAVQAAMLNDDVINGQGAEITSGLAAADELLYSDDGTLKKVGLDNFVELSPQLATEDAIAVASDYLLFLDGGATGNMNKESVADFVSAIAGTGLTASSGQLTASGGGINNAVIFRLSSDFTGDQDPISSNLEQDDTHADSTLGDSAQVSQASGIFTFPTEGHYLVQAHVLFGNGAADAETNLHIQVSVNANVGSPTYNDATVAQGSVYNSSARTTMVAQTIVDVSDKATHKVRFKISGNSSSNTVFGSTSINYTYFTFIRLADTDS